MARLIKMLKQGKRNEIGLVNMADGSPTQSPADSLNRLCDVHFPGSLTVSPCEFTSGLNLNEDKFNVNDYGWITKEKVIKAINQFKNGKAPGLDKIDPYIMKQIGPNMVNVLTYLYRAIISSGHTPYLWRTSKVMMLPKPGKKDYAEAKAFRPISLTPFFFKTLERITYWEIMETALKDKPIS